jgi:TM2 domain-containing membrane protein YozV
MDYIKPLYSHTSLYSWQKANLDYNWYWVLATFFGWCALDQLYLGSPYGFLAKNFVNTSTFGYWYFYDMIRATFDQESVKFGGPGIPGLGTPGLAAGRFQRPDAPLLPESKAKHKNFFIYTLVLFIFGIAGGDSFLVGNTLSGIIRLCCLLSFIFAPIAIIWWLYRIVVYLVYPTFLLEQEWNFFDYPKPDNAPPCSNLFAQFTVWVLQTLRGILNAIPLLNLVTPLLDVLIESLQVAYGMAEAAIGAVASTVTTTAEAGKLLYDDSMRRTTPSLDELKAIQKQLPGAKSCGQAGGSIATSSAPALALLLSVTVGIIIVSGVVLSLRRSYQKSTDEQPGHRDASKAGNDKPRSERNDAPPDPGASGDPTPAAAES